MNYNQYMNEQKYLAYLSIYTKNIIVYKANETKSDKVHVKSFSSLLNRRLKSNYVKSSFFEEESTILKQFLSYLESCGEIKHLGNGYYTILPERNVVLPVTKKVIKVGGMKKEELGFSKTSVSINTIKTINLSDYRYDLNVKEWNNIFDQSTNIIHLYDEEYYKPTSRKYLKINDERELIDGEMYLLISKPFENKREYFIGKRINNVWRGVRVNNNYQKSILSLLIKKKYQPYYTIEEVERANLIIIVKVILSDYLPVTEMEQVYLFSSPKRIFNNKVYYIQKEYLKDFIFILNKLNFKERNVIK